jgi:flagellar assembly protein FliH
VQPETVVVVAEEVLSTLLSSARQVVLRLHPDDHALAQAQLAEVLAARGVRLLTDANLSRGGCLVESDIAVVDATVEARWDRAAAALGHRAPWNDGHEAHEDTSVTTLAERLEAASDARTDLAAEARARLQAEHTQEAQP